MIDNDLVDLVMDALIGATRCGLMLEQGGAMARRGNAEIAPLLEALRGERSGLAVGIFLPFVGRGLAPEHLATLADPAFHRGALAGGLPRPAVESLLDCQNPAAARAVLAALPRRPRRALLANAARQAPTPELAASRFAAMERAGLADAALLKSMAATKESDPHGLAHMAQALIDRKALSRGVRKPAPAKPRRASI